RRARVASACTMAAPRSPAPRIATVGIALGILVQGNARGAACYAGNSPHIQSRRNTLMHTALVTGGTKGIGLGIARAIVPSAGRDDKSVAAAVTALDPSGKAAAGRAADVRDRAGVDRVVADTVKTFGSLNVVVNNAGVGAFTDVASMSDEAWASVIDTNLTGVF